MDKSTIIGCRLLFTIVLSLSSPVIYAEVSNNGVKPNDVDSNRAMPAQQAEINQQSTSAPSAWALRAEQWELARSGETLLSVPVLKQVMRSWLSDKQKVIEIQYPGGEDGEFWVHELTDWLVSLGIPSKVMVTTPGSGADDVIKFNIIKNMK